MDLGVESFVSPPVAVLRLRGDLDLHTASQVPPAVDHALERGCACVRVGDRVMRVAGTDDALGVTGPRLSQADPSAPAVPHAGRTPGDQRLGDTTLP